MNNKKIQTLLLKGWAVENLLAQNMGSHSIGFYIKVWLMAFRVPTLSASIVPVALGSAMAFKDGTFSWSYLIIALFCSVLIQIGTNLANDYYDYLGGIDARISPVDPRRIKLLNTGVLKAKHFYQGFHIAFILAFIAGLYLVAVRGVVILLIGLISIATGLAYSTGPLPLAKNALGDVFVFLFFGPVAVVGSYYLQTGYINEKVILSSLPIGMLATAILVIDNLRDIDIDRRSGKNTLAVYMGPVWMRVEYILLVTLSFAILFYLAPITSPMLRLPAASLILAFPLLIQMLSGEPDKVKCTGIMNKTAALHFIYGLLLSLGCII